jgi:hypothetical protein
MQGRVRRTSFEPNPAAMQFFSQDVYNNSNSYKQQDPLSLLLGQDMAAAAATAAAGMNPGNMNGLMQMNGLPPMSAGGIAEQQQHFAEPLCMPPGTNGFDSLPLEAEEPGPLPCLPRPGRMAGGYGGSAALLMQQQQLQQLQRCGYPSSGAPGPGGSRGMRPRRHSVTIGMLNEHQQQQALLAAAGGQLPQGWLAGASGMPGSNAVPGSGQPPRMPMLPQHSSPNKQLQELQLQAAAAQLGLGKAGLGQAFGHAGGAGPGVLHGQQLAGNAAGLGGPPSSGNPLLSMDLPPAYGMHGPRMPGNSNSRRHSWAPMGAEGSMAYARSWLLQQQQQASGSLTAQLGDAGALFINQQQQDQLGMGRLGPPLLRTPRNGLDSSAAAAFNATGQGMLDPGAADLQSGGFGGGMPGQGGLQMSVAQPSPVMPLYGSAEALAKEQLAQHLQQQLQLQDLASRLSGAQQGLDPYAEPFVSQGPLLGQHAAAGLASMDAAVYATALQQELQQQQQQSVLALQLCEDVGLSPAAAAAAASMYAPLQINGVSVDTQLLVSPYADNWDVLGQSSAGGSLSGSGSAVSSSSGMSALAGVGMAGVGVAGPLGQLGMAGKPTKGHGALMQMSSSSGSSANSSGSGSASGARGSHVSACTPSSSTSISSAGSKAGAGAAPAAAAAAAATMLASLPPLSKVCSEAPWNLKKAADEDAKVMSAQQKQLQKLTAVLERSRTLQEVHAAEDAAAEASAACAAAAAAGRGGSSGTADAAGAVASADNAAALFSYRLPDSGDDTWGGSSGDAAAVAAAAAAAAAVVPGGSCISQEPSNKLFVGNIGWWVTEEDLLHWFSRFGSVVNVKVRLLLQDVLSRLGSCVLTLCLYGVDLVRRPNPSSCCHHCSAAAHALQLCAFSHHLVGTLLFVKLQLILTTPSSCCCCRSCTTRARCTSPRTSGAAGSMALSITQAQRRPQKPSCGWTALSCLI